MAGNTSQRKAKMSKAPEFAKGQTIKLTEELEVQTENGYYHFIPRGTEVTVSESCPDADYWEEHGVVNMDIEYYADVDIQHSSDPSGQSDWTESASGVANIDYRPNN